VSKKEVMCVHQGAQNIKSYLEKQIEMVFGQDKIFQLGNVRMVENKGECNFPNESLEVHGRFGGWVKGRRQWDIEQGRDRANHGLGTYERRPFVGHNLACILCSELLVECLFWKCSNWMTNL
jgi:hypothetical protein